MGVCGWGGDDGGGVDGGWGVDGGGGGSPCHMLIIKIRLPASALLDYLLCPPGPGAPAAIGQGCPRAWRA